MHIRYHLFALLFFSLSGHLSGQVTLGLRWADANGAGLSESESATKMAHDRDGNVFVIGEYEGVLNLDPGNPLGKLVSGAYHSHFFLAKYSPQGQLSWLRDFDIGGELADIAIGPDQSIVLTGHVERPSDLDPGPGKAMAGDHDGRTAFLLSLDAQGQLMWMHAFGYDSYIHPQAIALDSAAGSIYLTGNFRGNSDFDPLTANYGFAPASTMQDAFVARYDLLGNFNWVKVIAGAPFQSGVDVITTTDGHLVVAFLLRDSADYDPGPGRTTLMTLNNNTDYAFAKYDALGNFVWANKWSGPYREELSGLVAGPNGTFWMSGTFQGGAVTLDRFTGAGVFGSGSRSFVARYAPDGLLIRGDLVGQSGAILAYSLDRDDQNGLYLAGSYFGTCDIDNRPGQTLILPANGSSYFVARFDTLMQFGQVQTWDGVGPSSALQALVTPGGGIVSLASFDGEIDVDPGPGTATLKKDVAPGFALCHYGPQWNYQWASTALQEIGGIDAGKLVEVDQLGNTIMLGTFQYGFDLDKGPAVDSIISNGSNDIFVQKLDTNGDYLWGWSIGHLFNDNQQLLMVDGNGGIHLIVDFFDTIDMDPGPNTALVTAPPTSFSFGRGYAYAHYDPNGNLIRAAKLGTHAGDANVDLYDAVIDPNGRLLICGKANDSVDLDPGPAEFWVGTDVYNEYFVACLDAGGQLAWARNNTASGGPPYRRIALGRNGEFYLGADLYQQMDLDPDPVQTTMTGPLDRYTFTRFDPNGNYLSAAVFTAPNSAAGGYIIVDGMETDSSGNLHVIGRATPGFDLDPSSGVALVAPQGQDSSGYTAFLLSLDRQGNLRHLDGMQSQPGLYLHMLDVSPGGIAAVHGHVEHTIQLSNQPLIEIGMLNRNWAFCAVYEAGAWKSAGTFAEEGVGYHYLKGIAALDAGRVVVVGQHDRNIDIDPQGGVVLMPHAGQIDAFWACFSTCAAPTPSYTELQRIVCHGDAPFTLSAGQPAGGTYLGAGVSGNVFTPSQAGLGPVIVSYQVVDASGCTSTDSDTIYVNACTGTVAPFPATSFQLYPNPSTGRLALTASDWQDAHLDLQLYNAWGQQVHSARLREGDAELQLDHLPAGMYLVTISGNAGKKTLRWIKAD